MTKFENEWYNKGYEDGIADAVNNPNVESVIEQMENLSKEKREKIILKYFPMKEIKCTIWKDGNGIYRITVNDIRYRKLDTACISDIDILFESMEEIKEVLEKEQGASVVFETIDKEKIS